MLTPEQISSACEDLDGIANIKAINKMYREQDESNLWPISGKFNCTNRAINRVAKFQRDSGAIYGLEYCYAIDDEISKIVNNEDNW